MDIFSQYPSQFLLGCTLWMPLQFILSVYGSAHFNRRIIILFYVVVYDYFMDAIQAYWSVQYTGYSCIISLQGMVYLIMLEHSHNKLFDFPIRFMQCISASGMFFFCAMMLSSVGMLAGMLMMSYTIREFEECVILPIRSPYHPFTVAHPAEARATVHRAKSLQ